MKTLRALSVLLLAALLVACGSEKKAKKSLGASQHVAFELLVVTNKDWYASGNGEPLRSIVNTQIEGLTQPEYYFRPVVINPSAFQRRFPFYAHIIKADVDAQYAAAQCTVERNVTCQPQIVVTLTAPDNAQMAQLCEANRDRILSLFIEDEFAREQKLLRKNHSGVVDLEAKNRFGATILAPVDLTLTRKSDSLFSWISTEDDERSLCLYALPMHDVGDSLALEWLLQKRDSVTQRNIQGEHEGQFVHTNHPYCTAKSVSVGGRKALQLRGLWDMKGGSFGGPFVAYAFPDSAHQLLLVADAFVLAPGKAKRAMVFQMEAALRTLNF